MKNDTRRTSKSVIASRFGQTVYTPRCVAQLVRVGARLCEVIWYLYGKVNIIYIIIHIHIHIIYILVVWVICFGFENIKVCASKGLT